MPTSRNISTANQIIARPGDAVKAKIIGAGLSLSHVAARARIARSTLSDYLAGRTRNIHGQINIMMAFGDLTGKVVSMRDFWGELAAPEAA